MTLIKNIQQFFLGRNIYRESHIGANWIQL